jgi:hypothetical protein
LTDIAQVIGQGNDQTLPNRPETIAGQQGLWEKVLIGMVLIGITGHSQTKKVMIWSPQPIIAVEF